MYHLKEDISNIYKNKNPIYCNDIIDSKLLKTYVSNIN